MSIKDFEEARDRYYSLKNRLETLTKEIEEAKEEYKKSIEKLSQNLKECMEELNDSSQVEIPKPTFTTAIVEIMEKEPEPEKKILTIEERYKEKEEAQKKQFWKDDKISKEEKEIYENKIKPKLRNITPNGYKDLGISKEAIRNWLVRGTNPSKENYDKLMKYFNEEECVFIDPQQQKMDAILKLRLEGKSLSEIALLTKIPKSTVAHILQKHNKDLDTEELNNLQSS